MSPRASKKSGAGLLAGSGVGAGGEWRAALDAALDGALAPLAGATPDLLLLFASDVFSDEYMDLLALAAERSGAHEIAGCSGHGIIGPSQELESTPAVAALALRLPQGSFLSVRPVTQADVEQLSDDSEGDVPGPAWPRLLGLLPGACTGLIVLVDPFSLEVEPLIKGLSRDYPGVPIVGGMASSTPGLRRTYVFSGSQAMDEGGVVIGLSGNVALRAVVSQGCEPIGQPWTITEAHGHIVRSIGNRPASEVLLKTLQDLEEPERTRAARNLLVGLAMDEYREEFKRGDFLIRNLVGVDRASGALAIGARPQVGQTLQFQVRDARAADEELRHLLERTRDELESQPAAALLFACNGRGAGMFGQPHHDVQATREALGAPPIAGFFCNGEIGPVGKGTYLHGFTASLGLIVPKTGREQSSS